MTEFVYPTPPGVQEFNEGGGKRVLKRPCAALNYHGNPCKRAALTSDTLCNSHREQVERNGRPVRLQGGGVAAKIPQGDATVINLFDGQQVDMSGFNPTRQPLPPEERRRLAYLQMEHVVVHGSPPQQTKAAELIFKYTPDLEKAVLEERDLDEEIFALTEAIEQATEHPEQFVPMRAWNRADEVRQLVEAFTPEEMDQHLAYLERLGAIEPYEQQEAS